MRGADAGTHRVFTPAVHRQQVEREGDEITVSEAERYIKQGHFGKGSMEPKMLAAVRFVRSGGKQAIISSLDKALPAIEGRAGTRITA